MKRIHTVPSKNKNKKNIQWILDDDVVKAMPMQFINGLKHGKWHPLLVESKKVLKKFSDEQLLHYKKAEDLTVVSLHPYRVIFKGANKGKKSYSGMIG